MTSGFIYMKYTGWDAVQGNMFHVCKSKIDLADLIYHQTNTLVSIYTSIYTSIRWTSLAY